MRWLERFTQALAWAQIAVSPLLIGALLGWLGWVTLSGTLGLVLGISLVLLGTGAGIWAAERVRRKADTRQFMARIRRHPELDKTTN